MNKPALVDKIKRARAELSEAEANVAQVLRELKVSARADKSMIGEALQTAFSKLKLASEDLADLEQSIESAAG